MCCKRLGGNTGRKNDAKNRHLSTTAQLCRAIFSYRLYMPSSITSAIGVAATRCLSCLKFGSTTWVIRVVPIPYAKAYTGWAIVATVAHPVA